MRAVLLGRKVTRIFHGQAVGVSVRRLQKGGIAYFIYR